MSILSEINRIKTAKDAIKQSIVAKGVAVDENAKLSAFPSLIENIPVAGEQKTIEDFLIYAEDLYGNEYKVQWFDYDGTMIKEQILHSLDEQIVYPEHPTHEGLLDDGWTADITTMNEVKDIMQKNTFYIAALYDVDESYAPENTTIDVVVYKHIDEPIYVNNNYCFSSTLKLGLLYPKDSNINVGGYVDWGDGTTTNITAAYETTNWALAEHNFDVGKYTITIHASMPCTAYAKFSGIDFLSNRTDMYDNSCYAYIDKINQVNTFDDIQLKYLYRATSLKFYKPLKNYSNTISIDNAYNLKEFNFNKSYNYWNFGYFSCQLVSSNARVSNNVFWNALYNTKVCAFKTTSDTMLQNTYNVGRCISKGKWKLANESYTTNDILNEKEKINFPIMPNNVNNYYDYEININNNNINTEYFSAINATLNIDDKCNINKYYYANGYWPNLLKLKLISHANPINFDFSLSSDSITDLDITNFSTSKKCNLKFFNNGLPNLRHFYFNENFLKNDEITYNFNGLKSLDSEICDYLFKSVKKLEKPSFKYSNVKHLDLSNCEINDKGDYPNFLYTMETCILPKQGITELAGFDSSYCLKYLDVPDYVPAISSQFNECYSLQYINFGNTRTTIPTCLNSSVFNNCFALIVVPDALYDEWIASTNWLLDDIKNRIVTYSYAMENIPMFAENENAKNNISE